MSNLSHKSESEAINYLKQIANQTFDQDILKSLLISIRKAAPSGSFTREMGDFVAHPEKDRGEIVKHLELFTVEPIVLSSGQRVICGSIPKPKDGFSIVDDLSDVIFSLGLDKKAVDDNRAELLLCYFGLLHLATVTIDKKEIQTLKISHKFRSENHGLDPLLSIVSVDGSGNSAHIFYSNLKAEAFLGSLKLIDSDLNTMLRVARDGHSLKIIQI